MRKWTNLYVALMFVMCNGGAQSGSVNELLSSSHGLSATCGSPVLPIDISLSASSVNILDIILNGYSSTDCSGASDYSSTWTTPAPGAVMYPKTYYLCTNSLLNPANSACVAGMQSMSFQMVNGNGYKSPLSCQQVTCAADVFTPTGTAWSNSPSKPSGRVIGYLEGWQTPPSASALAAAGYTHVLIAFGLFSTTSYGTINLGAISGFDLATYVQDLHTSGIKVLLSIGGASTNIPNTTVNFSTAISNASSPAQFQTTFVNNMVSLINTYGLDGFDFDIEFGLNAASSFTNPAGACSDQTYTAACDIYYLSNIINRFHARSPTSMISLVPQIPNIAATAAFSSVWGNYASLIMQIRPALTWVAFQNYNSGCAYGINGICYPTTGSLTSTADPAVAFATDLLENWPTPMFNPYISLLSPSQVVVGYTVQNLSGQCDGSPCADPAVTKNVLTCLRTHQNCATYTPPSFYPGIGGVFAWTINYDANNNYQFATSLSTCVVSGNCN